MGLRVHAHIGAELSTTPIVSLHGGSVPPCVRGPRCLPPAPPGRGVASDTVKEAPEGETSTAGHMGEQIPMESGEEGRIQFGP